MSLPAILKDSLSPPVIGSPLFIISVPDLVIAHCKAGIVGYVGFPGHRKDQRHISSPWPANRYYRKPG